MPGPAIHGQGSAQLGTSVKTLPMASMCAVLTSRVCTCSVSRLWSSDPKCTVHVVLSGIIVTIGPDWYHSSSQDSP